MSASEIPSDLLFQSSHEWIRVDGDTVTCGISDHAQAELTDVVFVELPAIGKTVDASDPIAVVESVKAASDIYSPLSGEVIEVNPGVEEENYGAPTITGAGWIFKFANHQARPTPKPPYSGSL